MTHDPLTPSQIALLAECDKQPIEMKVSDATFTPRGQDLQFLLQAGYFTAEQTHLAHDNGNNVFRYTRTDKAYQAA